MPSGRVIAIGYDAANRPVTLQGSLNGTTNYIGNPASTTITNPATWIQYWPSGSPLAFTRGNGLTYAAEYNGRLQQIESFETLNYASLTAANAPSNILFASCPQWGYGSVAVIVQACPASPATGDNGNLWGYSESLGGPGNSVFATFAQSGITYDGVNRLVGITDSTGNSTNWSRQFGYDAYGNMNVTGSSGTTLNPDMPGPATTYNTKNQRSDPNYAYDSAGNLQSIQVGQVALTYDAENRQISAGSASYAYDGNGRRVVKNSGGIITTYVYNSAGELTAEYTSVPPSSAPPCTTCYLSYDHLGSVRLITDGSGHLVSRHDYLPFGEEIMQGQAGRTAALSFQSSDDVTQRFTGKERDLESGLDYFGARYYGSALGRWTSPDEIFGSWDQRDPQTLNLYGYVRNNPLRYTDTDGHDWNVCVTDGKGGQICGTLSDGAYQALVAEQNGRQGIILPTSTVAGGPQDITCGGAVCGSASHYENGLEDPVPGLVAGAMAGEGVGFALKAVFRGIVSFFTRGAGEEGGVVIGKMADLKEPGALKAGERELDLPNLNDAKANWAQNSSRLREAMGEGKPIRDASAEPMENGSPGKNTGFLRAERNLLENHGWSYSGGYWYPPSK